MLYTSITHISARRYIKLCLEFEHKISVVKEASFVWKNSVCRRCLSSWTSRFPRTFWSVVTKMLFVIYGMVSNSEIGSVYISFWNSRNGTTVFEILHAECYLLGMDAAHFPRLSTVLCKMRPLIYFVKMKIGILLEIFVPIYKITQRHIPEDDKL
jgi:hypothetical protein